MRRAKRDEGFSVAEVVIAVAIMFFVLTAIVGLMGVSSQMTVEAKQKSVLVNAVASEIDRMRAVPFASLAGGSVERDINGVEITIDTTVLDRDAYKLVRIVATGVLQGRSQTYTTSVAVRDPEHHTTLSTDVDAPKIEFTDSAAAADEVLFASERLAGGSISLETKSESPSDSLSEVRYQVANQALIQTSGSAAMFTPSGNPYYAPATWNTLSEGIYDGFQTVSVAVTDSQNRTVTTKRRYIIDNLPALAPGVPSGVPLNSMAVRLSWAAARDGGIGDDPAGWFWASQYEYSLYREPLSGGGSPSGWPVVATTAIAAGNTTAEAIKNKGPITTDVVVSAGGPALTRATPPFSRFFVRVKSGRPRGIGTAYADSTTLVVSSPELICDSTAQSSVAIGAKSGSNYPYAVTLNVSRPNFPFTGTPVYTVQSLDLANTSAVWTNMALTGQTITNYSGYAQIKGSKAMSLKPYAFRVLVNGITPSGYSPSGALPQMVTNAAKTPTSVAKSTSYNLTLDWGL